MTAEPGPTEAFHFIVLSHNGASNALGRALSMDLIARSIGMSEVWAFGHRPTWRGAAQFPAQIRRLDWRAFKRAVSQLRADQHRIIFIACKGLDPLPSALKWALQELPDALAILDLDDDDQGLARDFVTKSLANRVRLNPSRRGSAWRISRSQRRALRLVQGTVFATDALRVAFRTPSLPTARVPHVRVDQGRTANPPNSAVIKVGVLGTIRPHKGGSLIARLTRRYPDVEVHAFAGSGLENFDVDLGKVVLHDPVEPLPQIYKALNVSLIPISATTQAGDLQLPAKIVDAFASGVPVVATPTTAIREICGEGVIPLRDPESEREAYAAIKMAMHGARREAARSAFELRMTPASGAVQLMQLIGEMATLRRSVGAGATVMRRHRS